jgi:hypothetical protein
VCARLRECVSDCVCVFVGLRQCSFVCLSKGVLVLVLFWVYAVARVLVFAQKGARAFVCGRTRARVIVMTRACVCELCL